MKRTIIALVMLIASTCSFGCRANWENAPSRYRCTPEQMEKVVMETEYAIKLDKGDDMSKTFEIAWYGWAIMRNCEEIKE